MSLNPESVGDFFYSITKELARGIFKLSGPVNVLHGDRAKANGAFLLASNHISHFDPPLLSVVMPRPVDWMAMAELFQTSWSNAFFRKLNAIPTHRDRPDRTAVREALERLAQGRVVGIFPEGGIRAKEASLLEGAPIRPGVAALAQMASVPVLPCVLLGTDRLYNRSEWWPWKRTPIWVGFGDWLCLREDLPRAEAREQLERDLQTAFLRLYEEMKTTFQLTEADLPHTPQERMAGH